MSPELYIQTCKQLLREPLLFVRGASRTALRSYQREVLEAIFDSILNRHGLSFVVMFPRQSGKNELQAQLEVYLLSLMSKYPAEMVKVSPTLQPQSLNAMRRLEKTVKKNVLINTLVQKEAGSLYRLSNATITFLSGAPESNIVGATASVLLEVDEAQDVLTEKFDRDIAPMAASTHATRVFWGTAWTSQTLLGRELRAARAAERHDGIRRVFIRTADEVGAEVPAYALHVQETVSRQGRMHPLVRTQYFSEEIDGEGGLFPHERIARMRSTIPAASVPPSAPRTGGIYALLLDVAGEDEGVRGKSGELSLANPARDATALTLVEITPAGTLPAARISFPSGTLSATGISSSSGTLSSSGILSPTGTLSTTVDNFIHKPVESVDNAKSSLPVYSPVRRWQWLGARHTDLAAQIERIARDWHIQMLVIDSTGVGAGLASFLEKALPGRVLPFLFNAASKSKLGWDFLAIVDSGRWREPNYAPDLPGEDPRCQAEFIRQLEHCRFSVSSGPEQHIRWGVPDGTRDELSGELLHDDWILSAALCAQLESLDWSPAAPALIIPAADPLKEMEGKY